MKSSHFHLSCAALWAATMPMPLRAQSPLGTELTYQGRLEQNGSLVNDTCDCRFTLWDDPSAGAQVGPTLDFTAGNAISVADGLVGVELDFGASAFGDEARWLEVSVACPSGGSLVPLSPRQAITAAPAAQLGRGTFPSLAIRMRSRSRARRLPYDRPSRREGMSAAMQPSHAPAVAGNHTEGRDS